MRETGSSDWTEHVGDGLRTLVMYSPCCLGHDRMSLELEFMLDVKVAAWLVKPVARCGVLLRAARTLRMLHVLLGGASKT